MVMGSGGRMNILVLGCNGYIGSNLCKKLREVYPESTIVGIDKDLEAKLPTTVAKYIYLNLLDLDKLKQFFSDGTRWDRIYHLATDSGNKQYLDSIDNSISTQIDINLLKVLNIENTNMFILISSFYAEYCDAYGIEKRYQELLFTNRDFVTKIVRLNPVYGKYIPTGKDEKVINALCRIFSRAGHGEPIRIKTDSRFRSFCYIDNVVMTLALINSSYPDGITLIESEGMTVEDLAKKVNDISKKEAFVITEFAGYEPDQEFNILSLRDTFDEHLKELYDEYASL